MISDRPRLPPGFRLHAFDAVASTNDEARALALAGAPEGTLVWAREQTAGRGRRGRGWDSPRGNLYASLVVRPACPMAEAAQLVFVAGLALGEAVAGLLPDGARIALKWPNDLLLDGRKLAGALLEVGAAPDGTTDWVVIGTGVNLVSHPDEARYPATDMSAAGAHDVSPETLLGAYLVAFAAWRARWRTDGFAPVRATWLACAAGVGERLEARLADETVVGAFEDIDAAGALMLRLADGGSRRIAAADIFPVAA